MQNDSESVLDQLKTHIGFTDEMSTQLICNSMMAKWKFALPDRPAFGDGTVIRTLSMEVTISRCCLLLLREENLQTFLNWEHLNILPPQLVDL